MKRSFLAILISILIISVTSCNSDNKDLADKVNPFIGTGGHGHTYPGAAAPFGMVQLSPDTRLDGWDGCGGYHYSDSVIFGFSHTHLSGTGVSDYGDILIMPTTGKLHLNNGSKAGHQNGYASKFSHKNESATAGYYEVLLEDYNIKAELTATERTGMHRYSIPENEACHIVLDLIHRDKVLDAGIKIVSETRIEGYRHSQAWAEKQMLFFVMEFSKPFSSFGIQENENPEEGKKEAKGESLRAWFDFDMPQGGEILVKTGLSAVSIEGAALNLETENPDWDFSAIYKKTKEKWNKELSKIKVEGSTADNQEIFYTALYHSMLNPNIYMDVDGKYRGRDLEIHQTDGFENYTVFSLWDTYRAAHPLFTIIDQKRTNDFINTFIKQWEQGGLLPVWELSANETNCMIGYHAVPVIADAWIKGIRGYDEQKALDAMITSGMQDIRGSNYYREYGFIPANLAGSSVSVTLEYAYDDWCIAQMAREMGDMETYKTYSERAQYYKNMFDPESGFMRPRRNNAWIEPFDPREVNFHYTEANCWQYSFYVPQDIETFAMMLGGKDALSAKLDKLFTEKTETTGRHQADITGLIGQYAHGNEPSHHMAYLYDYTGQPWKTQQKVRQIMADFYTTQPDGLIGNEDCGQMSAWYVFSSMGFYPVTPGSDIYALGSPVFDKASIRLENGKTFVQTAENNSPENIYVQEVLLNGEIWTNNYIRHEDIMNGGHLHFVMGPQPNKERGTQSDNFPPSNIGENIIIPTPYYIADGQTFKKTTEIGMACAAIEEVSIHYTTDGSEPTEDSEIFIKPIKINKTTTFNAIAIDKKGKKSRLSTGTFYRIPEHRNIELANKYAPQYAAGGNMALIDMLRGNESFATGAWQGFQFHDLEATVDLGKKQECSKLAIGFIQDMKSWIFMPEWVDFYGSADGKNFHKLGRVQNYIPMKQEGGIVKEFELNIKPQRLKAVKVVAKNIQYCPEWHLGAGGKAWLFADEITID